MRVTFGKVPRNESQPRLKRRGPGHHRTAWSTRPDPAATTTKTGAACTTYPVPMPEPPRLSDNHVHSEWSWDAEFGGMAETCGRAIELGLRSVAFTEHWDPTPCPMPTAAVPHLPPRVRENVGADNVFRAPPLDVDRYLAAVAECRERFPGLSIRSGVELGEPHWWPEQLDGLLGSGGFDCVLGSVHCIEVDGVYTYVDGLYDRLAAKEVVRSYLAEVLALAESSAPFSILAHIDYPARNWPPAAGAYDVAAFEDEHRSVLRVLARSGRALELNTTVPLNPRVLSWWREEGGRTASLGSDAHDPLNVGRDFAVAATTLESFGFVPDSDGSGLWRQ